MENMPQTIGVNDLIKEINGNTSKLAIKVISSECED